MSDIVERLGVAWEKQPGAAMTKINRILIERKDAIAEITRLRQLLSEAEKREREERVKALDEAAAVAEAEYKRHCTGSGFESQPARSTAYRILQALKALQSEER